MPKKVQVRRPGSRPNAKNAWRLVCEALFGEAGASRLAARYGSGAILTDDELMRLLFPGAVVDHLNKLAAGRS